ncbi:MAG: response regulator [Flavobacteriales bacterium]|nr:response regulator [Flavobacteriales bacterium]
MSNIEKPSPMLKAILVDDEERARDVLATLIGRFCEEVTVVAACKDLPEAVEAINMHRPDVVFLDIEMPKYAGFEIVNFFKEINFEIVFTTAYAEHAIRAFDMAAIDYLLKPIDIARLRVAVERVRAKRGIQPQQLDVLKSQYGQDELKQLVVTSRSEQVVVQIDRIIAIEAQESYSLIHTADKKHLSAKNLKFFEGLLATDPGFIRTHKSWLINRAFVRSYSKAHMSIAMEGGLACKLSRYKKEEFERLMGG